MIRDEECEQCTLFAAMSHEPESTYALEIVVGRLRSPLLLTSPCVAVRLLDFPTVVMRCGKQKGEGLCAFDEGYVLELFCFFYKSFCSHGLSPTASPLSKVVPSLLQFFPSDAPPPPPPPAPNPIPPSPLDNNNNNNRKSCLFSARPSDLAATLKTIPLYVMLVDAPCDEGGAATAPPRVFSTASLSLDAPPSPNASRKETLTLFSPMGDVCGDVEISVRLTDGGPALLRHFRRPHLSSSAEAEAPKADDAHAANAAAATAVRHGPLSSTAGEQQQQSAAAAAAPEPDPPRETEGGEPATDAPHAATDGKTMTSGGRDAEVKGYGDDDDDQGYYDDDDFEGDDAKSTPRIPTTASGDTSDPRRPEVKDGEMTKDGADTADTPPADAASFLRLLEFGVKGLVDEEEEEEEEQRREEADAAPSTGTASAAIASLPGGRKSGEEVIRTLLAELGDLVKIKDLLRGVAMDDVVEAAAAGGMMEAPVAVEVVARRKGQEPSSKKRREEHATGSQRAHTTHLSATGAAGTGGKPFLAGAVRAGADGTMGKPSEEGEERRTARVQTSEGLEQLCRPTTASKAAGVRPEEAAAHARQQYRDTRLARIAAERRALAAERKARALAAAAVLQTEPGGLGVSKVKSQSRPTSAVAHVGARRRKLQVNAAEKESVRRYSVKQEEETVHMTSVLKPQSVMGSTPAAAPAKTALHDTATNEASADSIQVPCVPVPSKEDDRDDHDGPSSTAAVTADAEPNDDAMSFVAADVTTEEVGAARDAVDSTPDDGSAAVNATDGQIIESHQAPTLTPTEELARRTLGLGSELRGAPLEDVMTPAAPEPPTKELTLKFGLSAAEATAHSTDRPTASPVADARAWASWPTGETLEEKPSVGDSETKPTDTSMDEEASFDGIDGNEDAEIQQMQQNPPADEVKVTPVTSSPTSASTTARVVSSATPPRAVMQVNATDTDAASPAPTKEKVMHEAADTDTSATSTSSKVEERQQERKSAAQEPPPLDLTVMRPRAAPHSAMASPPQLEPPDEITHSSEAAGAELVEEEERASDSAPPPSSAVVEKVESAAAEEEKEDDASGSDYAQPEARVDAGKADETSPLEPEPERKSPAKYRRDWRELLGRKLGRKIEHPKPLLVDEEANVDEQKEEAGAGESGGEDEHADADLPIFDTSADISAELASVSGITTPRGGETSTTTPADSATSTPVGGARARDYSNRILHPHDPSSVNQGEESEREASPGGREPAEVTRSLAGNVELSEEDFGIDTDDSASVAFASSDILPLEGLGADA
jgi:hypothetical protein